MLISRTPLRVSFLGGGTDYPSYYTKHNGSVLGGTINKYIYTTALPLAPFAEQKFKLAYRKIESVDSADDISHPVVKACLNEYNYDIPTHFSTMSDLPGGTGLGSSSAFTVGFIKLIRSIQGFDVSPRNLALGAIHIERDILNENVGVQDQFHAAIGGLARYEFCTDGIMRRQQIMLRNEVLAELNKSMILVSTNTVRNASKLLTAQENRNEAGANDKYLAQMHNLTTTGKNILESSNSPNDIFKEFGKVLDENWVLKKELSNKITNSTVDDIYDTGIKLGAYGGKLLGAGEGGFVLFITPQHTFTEFAQTFGQDNILPIQFEQNESTLLKY